MSADLDALEGTLAKLTVNAALTLSQHAAQLRQGEPCFLGRAYTGGGKWTTLAAMGVHNNLRKAGCIEDAGDHGIARLTPLGERMATLIASDVQGALQRCRTPQR